MFIRRKNHNVPGLNTTSTADISFMLLIFFLVTTSMDVDKGLSRQLPPPEPPKKEQMESQVQKDKLMELHISASNQLLVNGNSFPVSKLKNEVISFVTRVGALHLITIETDRQASYDLYFQVQNEIMAAYHILRDKKAIKKYGKAYLKCTPDQKEYIKEVCPQRISESYENAKGVAI